MRKRKLKPWVVKTLKTIGLIVIGFILTIALLFALVENHYYLLSTKYAIQTK